jgi:hypothetical protein
MELADRNHEKQSANRRVRIMVRYAVMSTR